MKDPWRTAEEQHLGCTTPKGKKTHPNDTEEIRQDSLVSAVTFHEHTHKNMHMCMEEKCLHCDQRSWLKEWKRDADKKV